MLFRMLTLAAVGLLIAADDAKQDPKMDAKTFEGSWVMVSAVEDGAKRDEAYVKKSSLQVEGDRPSLPSSVAVYPGSAWPEREVYDMFGVVFEGHPDLRRILMPEEFAAFPLRKDYPLRGRGERHNFPRLTRNES